MVKFANKIKLKYQKYQTNETRRYENHNGFVYLTLRTLCDLEHISNQKSECKKYLKENIYGAYVPQLQLSYICDTSNPLHKIWFSCVMMFTICVRQTKSWNPNSWRVLLSLKIQEH